MSVDNLIDDDWVAIRDFPPIVDSKNKTQLVEKNDFSVIWDDEKRLLNIFYKKLSDSDEEWMYNVPFRIDSFIANDEILKELVPHFNIDMPVMPTEPKGVWGYLSSSIVPEKFEENIKNYLSEVQNVLNEKMFLEMYFETLSDDEYLENLDELNRVSLLENIHCEKELLVEVSSLRQGSINLIDMLTVYTLEDETQSRVDIAEVVLYNFERQPFIQLREIARENFRRIQKKLTIVTDDEEKLDLSNECLDWQKQLKDNEICLSDLHLNYFEKCCANITACCDLMIEDQVKYGKEFQESEGLVRLTAKKKELSKLTIQLMQLKRKKLILKKEEIKENVSQLTESEHVEDDLLKLEKSFYKAQLNLFDMQMKIISEEEKLYRMLLKEFVTEDVNNNNIGENVESDEEEFFDSVQSLPENKNDNKVFHLVQMLSENNNGSPSQHTNDFFSEQQESSPEEEVSRSILSKDNNNLEINQNMDNFVDQFLKTAPVTMTVDMEVLETQVVQNQKKEMSEEWWRKQEIVQKLNRLYRKRAWLRNKKRNFTRIWKEKVDLKKEAEEDHRRHHAIHLKREKNKMELETKKVFLDSERRKTIERLHQYRKKYPEISVRTPARYTVPMRRTRSRNEPAPFRPGGPSVIIPGSATSLRIQATRQTLSKTHKEKPKKEQVIVADTKNNKSEIPENIDESTQIQVESIAPPLPPPPPLSLPKLTIPPQPPPPPPMSLPSFPIGNNKSFPMPPRLKRVNTERQVKASTGIDLNSIINARSNLKKHVKSDRAEDIGLTDVTATMLKNALDKMKRFTSDSSSEDNEETGDFFD